MTREDAAIGDNRDFQNILYDEVTTIPINFLNALQLTFLLQLLLSLGQFGNDSVITGNQSVVNVLTMGEFKYRRFIEDQQANRMVCLTGFSV
jgi:hypothetical protein